MKHRPVRRQSSALSDFCFEQIVVKRGVPDNYSDNFKGSCRSCLFEIVGGDCKESGQQLDYTSVPCKCDEKIRECLRRVRYKIFFVQE